MAVLDDVLELGEELFFCEELVLATDDTIDSDPLSNRIG
jgi:hypothetical protein